MIAGKSVLLIIGGGIAAYKAHELVRLLKTRGIRVLIIMTQAAEQFVTPLSLASLSGEKVHTALFNLTDEVEMGHIQLSRAADLVVVAPATADLMAKMANGLANDLATTALLATDKPVLIAPAMNVRMWRHPATVTNAQALKNRGIAFVGPDEGEMACGEFGPGRMSEPVEILNKIISMLQPQALPLSGKKVVVTAGPTREPIDPVRFISNYSSGKQGYAIARAAAKLGADTVLVSGPVALAPPAGIRVIGVESAREMLTACEAELPADIAIFTAAVADWRVAEQETDKIKKSNGSSLQLSLVENPDILATITSHQLRPEVVVGFAAETQNIHVHALEKLNKKRCDFIVANDVSRGTGVFGGDMNAVHFISRSGIESWPAMSKDEVGLMLMERLAGHLIPEGRPSS
ncbi:bifunctional phosphopantothenoylcysteine decarboxylase/phosphopantothenate--cysteine ligase CoaBC [Aestuariivirga sp.]|jgi:phosphopantothenoylcysteine decarboxylase/phosphopantothenate--cysteine ligase|uniref:bifunctional phosphopantothenoylcysteine decarboxylase/phosphopantothenate--cysteine ligase CoaBC n=1 Tax=Aestuariivirga sp. TaxID=2650926 RepID=UPI003784B153